MLIVGFLVCLVIVAAVAVVAAGAGDRMADVDPDRADLVDPSGDLQAADVASFRFRRAWRGYRMDEVDIALTGLAAALAAREDEVRRLQARSGRAPGAAGPDRPAG